LPAHRGRRPDTPGPSLLGGDAPTSDDAGGKRAIRLGQAWCAGGWEGILESLTPNGFTAFGIGAGLTLDGLLNGKVSPSDLLSESVLGLVPFLGTALSLYEVAATCF
jgi:hypothetical protein